PHPPQHRHQNQRHPRHQPRIRQHPTHHQQQQHNPGDHPTLASPHRLAPQHPHHRTNQNPHPEPADPRQTPRHRRSSQTHPPPPRRSPLRPPKAPAARTQRGWRLQGRNKKRHVDNSPNPADVAQSGTTPGPKERQSGTSATT